MTFFSLFAKCVIFLETYIPDFKNGTNRETGNTLVCLDIPLVAFNSLDVLRPSKVLLRKFLTLFWIICLENYSAIFKIKDSV